MSLVALLQDPEESVRTAAAEASAEFGTLDEVATGTLVKGLGSRDNMVRVLRRRRPMGDIGTSAQEAAGGQVTRC